MFGLVMVLAAQAQSPIRINVSDSSTKEVYLVCADRTVSAKVVGGVAMFNENVSNCRVEIRKEIGNIAAPGGYTCSTTGSGCQDEGIIHRATSDAPGRVNIIMTDTSADMFELRCGSTYRSRETVTEAVASFEGVPNGGCILYFKGMAPAKADGISPGTYRCNAINAVGKCVSVSRPAAPAPPPEEAPEK